MVKKIKILESPIIMPYYNQAIEASLLDEINDSTAILYIWTNDKTVFIGKNQNAYTECNLQPLKEAGGYLARRISGGGAVYHDKGNLNFTFLATTNNYNVFENFQIVLNAIRSLGINAEINGRNDLTIEGKKFSGNAFFSSAGRHFHHGTILISTLGSEIGRYLNVSKVKLEVKGVKSVVSRVTTLADYNKEIRYSSVRNALIQSFKEYYENQWKTLKVEYMNVNDIPEHSIKKWLKFFSNEKRIMGDDVAYNFRIERRFDWGTADIRVNIERVEEKENIRRKNHKREQIRINNLAELELSLTNSVYRLKNKSLFATTTSMNSSGGKEENASESKKVRYRITKSKIYSDTLGDIVYAKEQLLLGRYLDNIEESEVADILSVLSEEWYKNKS